MSFFPLPNLYGFVMRNGNGSDGLVPPDYQQTQVCSAANGRLLCRYRFVSRKNNWRLYKTVQLFPWREMWNGPEDQLVEAARQTVKPFDYRIQCTNRFCRFVSSRKTFA